MDSLMSLFFDFLDVFKLPPKTQKTVGTDSFVAASVVGCSLAGRLVGYELPGQL